MSTATDMLALYIAAEKKILAGQSVSMGGKALTMADLEKVRAGRIEWETKVAAETRQAAGSYGARHMTANFSDA